MPRPTGGGPGGGSEGSARGVGIEPKGLVWNHEFVKERKEMGEGTLHSLAPPTVTGWRRCPRGQGHTGTRSFVSEQQEPGPQGRGPCRSGREGAGRPRATCDRKQRGAPSWRGSYGPNLGRWVKERKDGNGYSARARRNRVGGDGFFLPHRRRLMRAGGLGGHPL